MSDSDIMSASFNPYDNTLQIGDQTIFGIADVGKVYEACRGVDSVQSRVDLIESTIRAEVDRLDRELYKARRKFTAEFVKELIHRCEEFANNREFTGMTDEEFEAEISGLLFLDSNATTLPVP